MKTQRWGCGGCRICCRWRHADGVPRRDWATATKVSWLIRYRLTFLSLWGPWVVQSRVDCSLQLKAPNMFSTSISPNQHVQPEKAATLSVAKGACIGLGHDLQIPLTIRLAGQWVWLGKGAVNVELIGHFYVSKNVASTWGLTSKGKNEKHLNQTEAINYHLKMVQLHWNPMLTIAQPWSSLHLRELWHQLHFLSLQLQHVLDLPRRRKRPGPRSCGFEVLPIEYVQTTS